MAASALGFIFLSSLEEEEKEKFALPALLACCCHNLILQNAGVP